MKKQVMLLLDENIFNHLQGVLKATGNNVNVVMENLIKIYLKEYFEVAAKECESDIKLSKKDIGGKALRKIPRWSDNKNLNAHKIIRAYLLLEDKYGTVTQDLLKDFCSDESRPDVYVPKFSINFAQMKIDTEKSLGKVFVEDNGCIEISEELQKTVRKFKRKFAPEIREPMPEKDYNKMSPPEIARRILKPLLTSGKVKQKEIDWLCTQEAAEHFDIDSIILINGNLPKQPCYYGKALTIHGKRYYLAANWTKRSRKQLIEWIEKYI